MAVAAKDLKTYTVEEFEQMDFPEGNKYELINGRIVMQATPTNAHQWISVTLTAELKDVVAQYGCITLHDVEVKKSNDTKNYVIPDIVVRCAGREEPVLVIEILSQDRKRDLEDKLFLYRKIGVSEYWLVDPKAKTVTVHYFAFNQAEIYVADEMIASMILPKLKVAVNDLFALIDKSGKKVLFPSGCEMIPFPDSPKEDEAFEQ